MGCAGLGVKRRGLLEGSARRLSAIGGENAGLSCWLPIQGEVSSQPQSLLAALEEL